MPAPTCHGGTQPTVGGVAIAFRWPTHLQRKCSLRSTGNLARTTQTPSGLRFSGRLACIQERRTDVLWYSCASG